MHPTFLKYLLYLALNPAHEYATEHCYAMKSGSTLPYSNRVCATSDITQQEIERVVKHFDGTPFRWFVDAHDECK